MKSEISISRTVRLPLIRVPSIAVGLLFTAYVGQGAGQAGVISIEADAVTPLPAGVRNIALISPNLACAIDRNEVRVHCVGPDGRVTAFGRAGQGPGEFESPRYLAHGDGGEAIVVYDGGLHRISVFSENGEFLSSAATRYTEPIAWIETLSDSTVLARAMRWMPVDVLPKVLAELNIHTGALGWERHLLDDHAGDLACGTPLRVYQSKLGGWIPVGDRDILFTACHGEFLLRFTEEVDERPTFVLRTPTYQERFPSEESVQRTLEEQRSDAASGRWTPGLGAEELRRIPKLWYDARTIDGRRRVWFRSGAGDGVAEPRETLLDVYQVLDESVGFLGTVRLDGDVTSIAAAGDRLVALRDEHDSADGRTLAWYEIGDLDL